MGLMHLKTAAYHPETNLQVKYYNCTIVSQLQHFILKNQKEWNIYVQPSTYAYNAQVHKSKSTTPFSLVLLQHLPGSTTDSKTSAFKSDNYVDNDQRWLKLNLLT